MRGKRVLIVVALLALAGCTLPFGGGTDAGSDADLETGNQNGTEISQGNTTAQTTVRHSGEGKGADSKNGSSQEGPVEESSQSDREVPVFELGDLNPADPTVVEGRTIDINATITNNGDRSGTTDVALAVADESPATETVTLAPGDTTTVEFTIATGELTDRSAEPDFTLSSANSSVAGTLDIIRQPHFEITDVEPGNTTINQTEPLAVSATVENRGDREGTQFLSLDLDGTLADSRELTLAGGESTTVTFEDVDTDALDEQHTYSLETRNERTERTLAVQLTADQLRRHDNYLAYGHNIVDWFENSTDEIDHGGVQRDHVLPTVSTDVEDSDRLYVTMDYEDGMDTHYNAALAAVVVSQQANFVWQDARAANEDPDSYLPDDVEVRFVDPELGIVRMNYTVATDTAVDYYRGELHRTEYANETIGDYDRMTSNKIITDAPGILNSTELYHGAHIYEEYVRTATAFNDTDTKIKTNWKAQTIQAYVTWNETGPVGLGKTMMLQLSARYMENAATPNVPRGGFDFYIRNETPHNVDILGTVGWPELLQYSRSAKTNEDLSELSDAANIGRLGSDEQLDTPFGIEN